MQLLSSQIISVEKENNINFTDMGPFAIPAVITDFDPTIFSIIKLAEPLKFDVDQGSVITITPPIKTTFTEAAVLEPGRERVFTFNTSFKNKTPVIPFIMSSSTDGKTDNTISISNFSVTNYNP